jgi:hypothetical protein
METRKPSCVLRVARPFLIPVVHSLLGVMRHVAALELLSRGGSAQSHGARGNTRANLDREARFGAEGHVAPSSSPHQGGEVWGRRTRGSTGAHLGREARSGDEGHSGMWMHALLLVLT